MSKIEWLARPGTAPHSWNPITGCTRVSPGCENCYAETMSHRLGAMGQPKYQGVTKPSGKWSGKMILHPELLTGPHKWKKPCTIFVCSMSDLFHPDVPDGFIHSLLENTINRHTYIILTKRAERMAEIMTEWAIEGDGYYENVWLGVSVEDQERADERIPQILKVPAAVRFLSVEPLLAPIDLKLRKVVQFDSGSGIGHLPIDWVIAGGESGPGARPCNIDWLQSIRDQCYEAGVPCFIKQLGSAPVEPDYDSTNPDDTIPVEDGHGRRKRSDPAILEAHGLNIREWPT